MKIRVTQMLHRTIELDVEAGNEQEAIAEGLLIAADIQDADWHYCEPVSEEGCSVHD